MVPPPARVSVMEFGSESWVATLYEAMIRPPLAGVTVAGVPGTIPAPKSSGTMPLSVTADCTFADTPMGAVEVWAASAGAVPMRRASARVRFTVGIGRKGGGRLGDRNGVPAVTLETANRSKRHNSALLIYELFVMITVVASKLAYQQDARSCLPRRRETQ